MGEIADMMLEGVLCEGCGEYMGGGGIGPRRCIACRPAKMRAVESQAQPHKCKCGKRFKYASALKQHRRDKHGEQQ